MPEPTPIMRRVTQLKGNMTFEEFSDDIMRKTGKRISPSALGHLATGRNVGRGKTFAILSEYSGKSDAWLHSSDAEIIGAGLLRSDPDAPKTLIEEAMNLEKYKDLIENFKFLSPEVREAVEIIIRTLVTARKEQSAMGE